MGVEGEANKGRRRASDGCEGLEYYDKTAAKISAASGNTNNTGSTMVCGDDANCKQGHQQQQEMKAAVSGKSDIQDTDGNMVVCGDKVGTKRGDEPQKMAVKGDPPTAAASAAMATVKGDPAHANPRATAASSPQSFIKGDAATATTTEPDQRRQMVVHGDAAASEDAANRKLGAIYGGGGDQTKDGLDHKTEDAKTGMQIRGDDGTVGGFSTGSHPTADSLLQHSVSIQSMPAVPVPAAPPAPSLPGAFPQTGVAGWSPRSSHLDHFSDSNFTINNTSEALRMNDDTNSNALDLDLDPNSNGLVQAQPVRPSQAFSKKDLEVAEPMEESKDHKTIPEEQDKNNFNKVYLLGGGLVLLLVVVIVIIIFATQSSSQEEQANHTAASVAPSAAPTQERLMSLLPRSTQAKLQGDIVNMTSSQSMAYQWMQDDPNFGNYSNAQLLQRFALASFYYATDGPNWNHQGGETVQILIPAPPRGKPGDGPPPQQQEEKQQGGSKEQYEDVLVNVTKARWLDYNSHECDWFSSDPKPMCRQDTEAIYNLKMIQNNLGGSLPEQLGLLTSMRRLELFSNNIEGRLSTEIGLMTNLEWFMLNSNEITGPIPIEVGQLSKLEKLSLLGNKFSGPIPFKVWTLSNLTQIKLMRNQLTESLPSNLGERLPKVQELRVGSNLLTGSLPSSVGLCTDLKKVDLAVNTMTGTLPTELGLLTELEELRITTNSFTGVLPSELGLLSKLDRLLLAENEGLTGTIPMQWGLLNWTLQEIRIAQTSVSGTIPSGLCQVEELQFDCSGSLCGCDCSCLQ